MVDGVAGRGLIAGCDGVGGGGIAGAGGSGAVAVGRGLLSWDLLKTMALREAPAAADAAATMASVVLDIFNLKCYERLNAGSSHRCRKNDKNEGVNAAGDRTPE